jgi:Zn-dependent M32 family carboxypeptidase
VMKNNYGKFRDVLSQRDVEMIETISMREMRELGYPSVTQANWKRGHPYVFRVSQKIKEVTSRRKNRDFIKNEMGILLDKQKFVKSLFSDLRK